jgi:hypothetical protein
MQQHLLNTTWGGTPCGARPIRLAGHAGWDDRLDQRGEREAPIAHFTRLSYSPVRVSTLMISS